MCAATLLGLYEAAERRLASSGWEEGNEQHQHREQLLADGVSLSSSARSIHASSEPGGNERTRRVCTRLRAVTLSAAAVLLIEIFRGLKRARPPASTQLTYTSPDVATPSKNRNTSARRLTRQD